MKYYVGKPHVDTSFLNCCENNDVPDECLGLCKTLTEKSGLSSLGSCLKHIKVIRKCRLEEKGYFPNIS